MNRLSKLPATLPRVLIPALLLVSITHPGCDFPSASKNAGATVTGDKKTSESSGALPTADPATAAKARVILDECIAKYKGLKSYEDRGVMRLRIPFDKEPVNKIQQVRFAFEAPNKLAIQTEDVQATWTSTTWEAVVGNQTIKPFENQRLVRPLPSKVDIGWLLIDNLGPFLDDPLTGVPLPLQLLFEPKPLEYWTNDTTRLSLLTPEMFDSAKCDRVQVLSRLGGADWRWVLWIDSTTHLLRKMELPFDLIDRLYAAQGGLPASLDKTKTELSFEYVSAKADEAIDWSAWKLPRQPSDLLVSRFIDPPPRNFSPLLGKVPSPFDLKDANGKLVLDSSQRAKPISILLWVGSDELSEKFVKASLEVQRTLAQRSLNASAEIVFVTQRPAAEMAAAFSKWNCDLPLAIDTEDVTRKVFQLTKQPAIVILGKNGDVQHVDEIGFLGMIPDYVETLRNGVDAASRVLINSLHDESRYASRLHRAVVDKSQVQNLKPIESFPFAFLDIAPAWDQAFQDRIIAAGSEQFYPNANGAIASGEWSGNNSKPIRLMSVLDENGYIQTVNSAGVTAKIAKLSVEKADGAKRIHVLPDPWTHRWIAIVPEGLPRFWIVESPADEVSDSSAEPPEASEFSLDANESVVATAWTLNGKKSSLSIATDASSLLVFDPVESQAKRSATGAVISIVPTLNDRAEPISWNLVDAQGSLTEILSLPGDGVTSGTSGPEDKKIKQLPFVPSSSNWTWGKQADQPVVVGMTMLPTGETGAVVQTRSFDPKLFHPLSVRPEQCKILSSTTLPNGAFYWLSTAPNRVLHLQTIGGIPDQMSLGKKVLGASVVPDGNGLKLVLASENDVSCWKLTIPPPPASPAISQPEAVSPSEKK
jgi:hypothetical protein